MNDAPIESQHLVIIIGSAREGRFGPTVASWMTTQAQDQGDFVVDVLDVAKVDPPLALPALPPKIAGADYPRPERMSEATRLLSDADAFLVVTPEYNHSYPASLKSLIDWHFDQWTAKPVAFASYGGAAGGRHAVLHLENVFGELDAVPLTGGLMFPDYFTSWTSEGPTDPGAAEAARTLLDRLSWWSRALQTARRAEPYPH